MFPGPDSGPLGAPCRVNRSARRSRGQQPEAALRLPDRARWATMNRVSKVTLTTELPIPAETAAALARKPELMRHVLSPVLRIYRLDVPERIEVGTQGSARFWWFGVIPAWTHHLTIKRLEPTEIYTNEHGDRSARGTTA